MLYSKQTDLTDSLIQDEWEEMGEPGLASRTKKV